MYTMSMRKCRALLSLAIEEMPLLHLLFSQSRKGDIQRHNIMEIKRRRILEGNVVAIISRCICIADIDSFDVHDK
jgi:hypothetical protein